MALSDLVLFFSGVVFLVGFLFTFFIFAVFVVSLVVKKRKFSADFRPPISVLVPVYNSQKTIARCINSIFSANYKKLEIIVVDDGSTDDSVKIARSFNGIKVIKLSHTGKVGALNEGIKHCENEFVLTLDSDTFLEKGFFENSLGYFSDKKVGAVCGVVKVWREKRKLLNFFARFEYLYNHLIMKSFSEVFNNSVWFFGGVSIYRKSVLKSVGFFKGNTLSEDLLVALEINNAGFHVLHASNAAVRTVVPSTMRELFGQRRRWWVGSLQSFFSSKTKISLRQNPAINFLFLNQLWWSFYSFICFPILFFLIWYWFPYGSFFEIFNYLFRWFSLFGTLYVIYKIPEWGLSFTSFFGVFSALLSSFLLLVSVYLFKEKFDLRLFFALFFYFPYALLMNLFVLLSVLSVGYYKLKGKSVGWY